MYIINSRQVIYMDKFNNKKKFKIVDTIEYNGKYVDAASIRRKFAAAGVALVILAGMLVVPIFLI